MNPILESDINEFLINFAELTRVLQVIATEIAAQNSKLEDIEAAIYHATSRPD